MLFTPKINKKSKEWAKKNKSGKQLKLDNAQSQHTLKSNNTDLVFKPTISKKSKYLATKKRVKRDMIPRPGKNRKVSNSSSQWSDRLYSDFKDREKSRQELVSTAQREEEKLHPFAPKTQQKIVTKLDRKYLTPNKLTFGNL